MDRIERLQPNDPERIGPYRLQGKLGEGGMGTVYLGESTSGRLVAVKVIHRALLDQPGFPTRFRREVELARAVSGAFTAAVVDADPESDPAWLATLYIPGPSLADAVRHGGAFSVDEVWRLAAGIAEALYAIHGCSLVHRDLKPANILLAQDGIRVIDFGISRAVNQSAITHTGVVLGTPGYMSPEQISGDLVGPASDVFSLGCVLAFSATGVAPFGDNDPFGVFYRIVHQEPDLSGLSGDLQRVVATCLSKNPYERPTLREILEIVRHELIVTPRLPMDSHGPTTKLDVPSYDPEATDAAVTQTIPRDLRCSFDSSAAEHLANRADLQFMVPPEVQNRDVPDVSALDKLTSFRPRRRWFRLISALGLTMVLLGISVAALQRYGLIDLSKKEQTTTGPSAWYGQTYRSGSNRLGSYDTPIQRPTRWRPWAEHIDGRPVGCTYGYTRIFCATEDGKVVALDASEGRVAWESSNLGGFHRPPTVSNNLVYVASNAGTVTALSPDTGRKVWSTSFLGAATVPAVVDGIAYGSNDSGHIFALNGKTGDEIWSTDAHFKPSVVSVAVGKVFSTGRDGSIAAFSTSSGSPVWRTRIGGDVASRSTHCGTPAVTQTHVFCTGSDGSIYAFSAKNGKRQWKYRMLTKGDRTVAVHGDAVYGADKNGQVYAIEVSTGKELWSAAVPGGVAVPPVFVDELLYLGTRSGHLVVLDAQTGAWKRTLRPATQGGNTAMIAEPLISQNLYYAASENGAIYSRNFN
ncbi:PQQ-binding-like beta-propeller repeat protein [Streptomyces sp. 1222.5]|uniref:serine/threonine-protein kinase n=1 Tax=Streptomyces sp. 1222.5 TaxID=1881026 RepID=UPI003EBE1D2B